MAGIVVFTSIQAARDAGYVVYDRILEGRTLIGYLVRTQKTSGRWAQALVDLRLESR